MKFPFVMRKKHDLQIKSMNEKIGSLQKDIKHERESYIRELKRQENRYEEEIREKIKPMVKKFINTRIQKTNLDFHKYQLLIQMDTSWVEGCLIHGNSQKEIKYLCEMISRQVYYELEPILKTRNFVRVHSQSGRLDNGMLQCR